MIREAFARYKPSAFWLLRLTARYTTTRRMAVAGTCSWCKAREGRACCLSWLPRHDLEWCWDPRRWGASQVFKVLQLLWRSDHAAARGPWRNGLWLLTYLMRRATVIGSWSAVGMPFERPVYPSLVLEMMLADGRLFNSSSRLVRCFRRLFRIR